MLRTTPRTLFAALATLVALVATGCNSNTVPPSPSAAGPTAAAPSIAASAEPPATPEPAPTASKSATAIGPGGWTVTGSMIRGRSYGATATVLRDGRVLVTGGEAEDSIPTAAAELYDPATGRWIRTGKLHSRRRGDVATLLADGRVLIIGGFGSPARLGELYDPETGTWTMTRPMARWRYSPSVAALPDGRVLVFGGWAESGTWTRRADLFDPRTGSWKATARMAAPAGPFDVLADGRVLVMHERRAPELFDPTMARWRSIASPSTEGPWTAVVRLGDDRVLALSTQSGAAELYDPVSNSWTATSAVHTGQGPAILLSDGTVLVVGKVRSARFDPGTGSWSDVPRPPLPRDYALDSIDGVELNLVARLLDGRVLATENAAAAIYDPAEGG